MKLSTKIFILIGLVVSSFLALLFSHVVSNFFYSYLIFTISFVLLSFLLLHIFVFSRIEQLEQAKFKKISADIKEKDSQINSITNEYNLSQLAHFDELMGLPNRIFFNNILNKTINYAKRHKQILAVLIVNLDKFKNINKQFTHSTANEILKDIGMRFKNALRAEDILAKLDGDEFIVLLSGIGKPKFASTVAKKLLNACSEPLNIEAKSITVTASIGICIYPNDGLSLETLLDHVNVALSNVKKSGGNNYQFYAKELDIEARAYLQLENDLRKAINNNELMLYYQPQILLKQGNITGVEALIRWAHPQLGLIDPEKFISIAEETGLIIPIGEWALYEACKMNKHWQQEGYEHVTVSVNLSQKQFYHPDIANMIANVLSKTGLNPHYLEIEITETIVMNDMELTTHILNKIKNTGVKISIDHFGTGYISVRHLKQIPISAIKIDQTFISGIPNLPNDMAIVNAFIALAHNLGFEIVAEGVESIEQAQYLAAQNCDMIQGYFLSYPVPAEKIISQFKELRDRILM